MYTPQLLTTRSWIPCSSTLDIAYFFWHHFKVSHLHLSPDVQWQSFSCVRNAWCYPVVLALLRTHFSGWAVSVFLCRLIALACSWIDSTEASTPVSFQPSPVITGRPVSFVHFSVAETALHCCSGFPVLCFSVTQPPLPLNSIPSRICSTSPLLPSAAENQRESWLSTCLSSPLTGLFFAETGSGTCIFPGSPCILLTHEMLMFHLMAFWTSTAVVCSDSSWLGLPWVWLLKGCVLFGNKQLYLLSWEVGYFSELTL